MALDVVNYVTTAWERLALDVVNYATTAWERLALDVVNYVSWQLNISIINVSNSDSNETELF